MASGNVQEFRAPQALPELVDVIERGQWTAAVLDANWRLQWVSPELQGFLGETDPERLGYGRPVPEIWLKPPWSTVTAAGSIEQLLHDIAPIMLGDLAERGITPEEAVPADLLPFLADVTPVTPPAVWTTDFHYVHPDGVEELGGYTVKALTTRLQTSKEDLGWLVIFDIDVPPRLVSLLARGDNSMYERMARLVQPGRHAAAILFCDLQGSGMLSRKLPTAEYFRLVRELWTAIDATVAEHSGVVGKHAGDGAAAFFLADDLGGDSGAARAVILTARKIHELSSQVFRESADLDCLMKIGVHWGGGLYMGQLVPGGRLDVTALGDEVNEAARIEEAADAHQTLASKQLIERLSRAHAAELGLTQPNMMYRLLSEVAPDREKIVRDAGNVAVTSV